MSEFLSHRQLDTSGDTLSWVRAEITITSDWYGDGLKPVLSIWDGVVAVSPGYCESGGGCG
jgi:hypothetical protein